MLEYLEYSLAFPMLPEKSRTHQKFLYGYTKVLGVDVPIAGAAGDQQAALFGQTML